MENLYISKPQRQLKFYLYDKKLTKSDVIRYTTMLYKQVDLHVVLRFTTVLDSISSVHFKPYFLASLELTVRFFLPCACAAIIILFFLVKRFSFHDFSLSVVGLYISNPGVNVW